VRINEAYQRLKDPLRRAAYLCELGGAPVNAENNTAMPPAFLMQQMEWRESLEEAHGLPELERLAAQVHQARQAALRACEALIDQDQDFTQAVGQVRSLMFIERFSDELNGRMDDCHDGMDTADRGQ
jgi:molecular chaperone HscB